MEPELEARVSRKLMWRIIPFVMLLEHLGEMEAAARVMQAIETVTANPSLHTGDLGGKATTAQVTAAVCELVGKAAVAA